jgi:2-phosphosulfolactate phosphatase
VSGTGKPTAITELESAWGRESALGLAPHSDVLVVVDVLSYGTAVDIAVSRGAEIVPADSAAPDLEALAAARNAILAGRRTGGSPYTLSPPSLITIPPGTRLLLPSPNGGAISAALAETGKPILLAALRNATAVARAAQRLGTRIGVVTAGEKTADGRLRHAEEDRLGLGALARALKASAEPESRLSEDAKHAAATFAAVAHTLPAALADLESGRELIDAGFPDDVRLAAELDVSDTVPILMNGAFRGFTQTPSAARQDSPQP